MGWPAIGAIVEIVGAIAVVLTLIYLSIQIKQNTIATKASATREIHDSVLAAHTPIYGSTESSRVFRLGCFEPDKLSPDENMQFEMAVYSIFASLEMYHSQFKNGLIEEDIYNRNLSSIRNLVATNGIRQWWSRSYNDFGSEFSAVVEEEISNSSERAGSMRAFFGAYGEKEEDGT